MFQWLAGWASDDADPLREHARGAAMFRNALPGAVRGNFAPPMRRRCCAQLANSRPAPAAALRQLQFTAGARGAQLTIWDQQLTPFRP